MAATYPQRLLEPSLLGRVRIVRRHPHLTAGPAALVPALVPALAAALVTALALSACSGQGNAESGPVRDAARQFLEAQATDAAKACAMLAPKTLQEVSQQGPCASVVAQAAPGSVPALHGVAVYGKDAMAQFEGDTVFLARFDGGWKVTAASCEPDGRHRPYSCDIQAG